MAETGVAERHWTETSENPALKTPEAKSILSKFSTPDDAAIGYIEIQKAAGRPYKLPDSLDKLPDDKTRGEFLGSVGKLLGAVEKEDDLKDIDFTLGMQAGEGEKPVADANMVKAYSKFVVDNRMPKAVAQKGIEFWNAMQVQASQRMEAIFKENADKVNSELITALGSAEKVAEKSELVKRMFQNDAGLSAEEFEAVGSALVSAGFSTDSRLTKALMNLADKVAGEGTTDTGTGGTKKEGQKSQYQQNKERWPQTPDMWGDPDK